MLNAILRGRFQRCFCGSVGDGNYVQLQLAIRGKVDFPHDESAPNGTNAPTRSDRRLGHVV